ncbi:MAG: glycosyltransferase family 4 protein [Methanotrichaceae archaeon]|jgi:glycosyltransferase involved in cell wall biosynthesis
MKICNIIQRYPPAIGGSEIWCQKVCQYISKKGNEVLVLTLNINMEEEFWKEPTPEDCILRLGPCNYDGKIKVRRYQRSLPVYWIYHGIYKFLYEILGIYFYGPHSLEMYVKMYSEIKNCDIVHTYTIPYPHNYISVIMAKLARKRIVITPFFHVGHPHYERLSFYILIRLCDAVIVMSDYEKKHFIKKGISPKKLFVTGAGVDPEVYTQKNYEEFKDKLKKYDINDETKLVVFLGRKTDYKGTDQLIAAAKKILLDRRDVKFLLVGPTNPWFDNLYNELSSEEKNFIIDVGFLDEEDKINLLHRADLLCLPSKFESFGIVYLEAWICNTAVIGSDRGAQPSVIEDGGLTFEYGNIVELTDKILYLLDNTDLSQEMVKNGKRLVDEKYTWDRIGENVLKIYETLDESKK